MSQSSNGLASAVRARESGHRAGADIEAQAVHRAPASGPAGCPAPHPQYCAEIRIPRQQAPCPTAAGRTTSSPAPDARTGLQLTKLDVKSQGTERVREYVAVPVV